MENIKKGQKNTDENKQNPRQIAKTKQANSNIKN